MAEDKARGSGEDLCWCLRRIGGNQEVLLLRDGDEVTLGRGLGVTYQLFSRDCPLMISRVHCIFRQNAAGQWTLTDNNSLNGVWLDKEKAEPRRPYVLRSGCCVQLGIPLAGSDTAEFRYQLVQEGRPPGRLKQPRTKRKLPGDDAEASGTQGPSGLSKAKLQRPLRDERPRGGADQDTGTTTGTTSDSATDDTATGTQRLCSSKLAQMRELIAEARRLNAALQGQATLKENSNSKEELRRRRTEVTRDLLTLRAYAQEQQRPESQRSLDRGLADQLAQACQEISTLIDEENVPDYQHLINTQEEERRTEAQREDVLHHMNDVLDNELQCIICSEHFIEAVTLNCAHSFCSYCIQSWRRRKDECPICRREITSQTRSLVLDNCINRMVDKLSADMKERRTALIRERKDLVVEAPMPPGSDSSSLLSDMSLMTSSDDSLDLDSDTEIDELSFSDDSLDLDSDDPLNDDDDEDDDIFILL